MQRYFYLLYFLYKIEKKFCINLGDMTYKVNNVELMDGHHSIFLAISAFKAKGINEIFASAES